MEDNLKIFAKEASCKPLASQYAMFFKDPEIRETLQVMYLVGKEEFRVTVLGTMFNGSTFTTKHPLVAANYVKLYMISKRRGDAQIVDELNNLLADHKDKPFEKLAKVFAERIQKAKMEVSDEALKDLGITPQIMASLRYGI